MSLRFNKRTEYNAKYMPSAFNIVMWEGNSLSVQFPLADCCDCHKP